MTYTVAISPEGNYKFNDRTHHLYFEPRGAMYDPVDVPLPTTPGDHPVYDAVVAFAHAHGYHMPGRISDPMYARVEALTNPPAL